MAIAIIYAVAMDFGLFMFLPASLANLEMEKMLEKKDGMQMEREVRGKEYEEPSETKGLKFNSPYDNIPISI